ncbi:MAG: hypothetical protein ACQUHE_15285 [Bacteroidia bacterium]
MNIIELKEKQIAADEAKLKATYLQFESLLRELSMSVLPTDSIMRINERVEIVNSSALTGKELTKLIKEQETTILKQIAKENKLVPKNYYRNLWMLFGISGIGLPIGVAIGLSAGNIGLLGIGLPIGMSLGLAIGMLLDKKALTEGKQLNIEIKQ